MAQSWRTVKESWGVLQKDKELLFFPVLSGIASLIVIASFLVPSYFAGLLENTGTEEGDPIAFVLYAAMYLTLAFVTIYFNSALVFAASERLKGGDPTVGSGLRGANKRLGSIFAWAMFAGTVSLLIHLLQRAARGQNNMVGSIITSLVGTAWQLATFFAVPVVIFENKGVFESLKRSGQLFKQRWGESLVGEFGIGFVFGLISILVVVATLALAFVAFGVNPLLGLAIVVLGALSLLLVGITGSALGTIYRAALYHYAAWGQVPAEFSNDVVAGAYHPR